MRRLRAVQLAYFLLLGAIVFAASVKAQEAPYLYRAQLVQAAPGRLLELIELFKAQAAQDTQAGDEPPWWMRHSQGDHWDLLLLHPVGSYTDYYRSERAQKRAERAAAWRQRLQQAVAWQEDVFVHGPPLQELRKAAAGNSFFHVEMFVALPGRHEDLRRQREMENAYLKALARPQNFIFVRDQGAAWDLFTVGVYRDIRHYAESADIQPDKQEAAAQAAGFESAAQIGPYLRTLIRSHHDTLCVAVK